MTRKREWTKASQLNLGDPPDEEQITLILGKIARGNRRGVRCFRRADGRYDVVDTFEAAWVEAYRRAGLEQVPVIIRAGRETNQVQKALAALYMTPADPSLSQQALAQQLGVSRSALQRALQFEAPAIQLADLHIWEKSLLDPMLPLEAGSIDLIAGYAPNHTAESYAPLLARCLSASGRIWLVFEATQLEHLLGWRAALTSAGLTFQRMAVWSIPVRRATRMVRLSGYRLLLAVGKPTAGMQTEEPGAAYPGWVGPRALEEVDSAQRIIPFWLWKRWVAELPSARIALDPFATSTTIFDAARSIPQLRAAWACPMDGTVRALFRNYLDQLA